MFSGVLPPLQRTVDLSAQVQCGTSYNVYAVAVNDAGHSVEVAYASNPVAATPCRQVESAAAQRALGRRRSADPLSNSNSNASCARTHRGALEVLVS